MQLLAAAAARGLGWRGPRSAGSRMSEADRSPDWSEEDEQRLDEARVASLFGVAKTAYVTTLVAGALLVAILWGPFTGAALALWYGLLAALTAGRVLLYRVYLRAPDRLPALRWEARFALGAFAAGALWALPPMVFFPEGDPLLQMAVIVVVGGSVIGAAGVYGASPAAFYGFSVLPILGVALQLAQQAGRTYQLLALLALVFGTAMIRVYRDIHASMQSTLRGRIEKERLVERAERSEARLREGIESFPEGIAVYDAEDRILVCNQAYAQVYGAGRSAAELAGTPYRVIARNAFEAEVVEPGYAGRAEDWLSERLARRSTGTGAVRHYRTRDGRSLQGRFVRSRGGGIVSVFTDVTELKRAQDAHAEILAEENLLLDTLPLGVAFLAERVIVRCNRRLEQMLGYAAGELNGKPARQLYPSDEVWQIAGKGYERLRSGAVLEGELELARKDGSTLWCSLLTRALDPDAPQASAIIAFTDAAERRAAARALRASEAMYRSLVETSRDLIWSVDARGRWTYLSPAAVRRIYGCEPGELRGHELREQLAQEVRERDLAVFRRILAGESVFDYETRHLRRDGAHVDLSFNAVPLRDAAGDIVGATGTARDISGEKAAAAALHESVEKLRLAVEAADLVYWEWDGGADRLHWGGRPGELLGAGEHEGRETRWSDYLERVHPEDRERYLATVAAAWEQPGTCASEYRVQRRDGSFAWISSRGKPLPDAAGRARRMIGVSQDVTERKRQEDEARFLAYHDTLTGLPNRRLLDDRLRQALYLAQRRGLRVAAMMVDLDRFKQVNDALGHRAGDAVLREAAQRLGACVRRADTLARHGGDEFAVVIPDLQLEADCQVVAEKILRSFEAPFRVEGRDFPIGASIGISLYPADAGDGEALLRNADSAMYRAKQLGRGGYRFYGR